MLNLPDLSVGIMLGVNSSKTKAIQTLGRIIRKNGDKVAKFFTLVINDTAETEWMKHSRSNDYEIIDVENLEKVLNDEPYQQYKRKIQKLNLRI